MTQDGSIALPAKPYPDFPLTRHPNGTWSKQIRGRVYYFGNWARRVNGKLVPVQGDGWKEALKEYQTQAEDIHAGRTPRLATSDVTLAQLCNRFLDAKKVALDAGEIGTRMFDEYKDIAARLVRKFGNTRAVADLGPEDFASLRQDFSRRWGPVRLSNAIGRVRSVFKFCDEYFDLRVRYGPAMKKPSASVLRRERAKKGERMLEAAECRQLIDAAPTQLRAILLLMLNAALGGQDCALLPFVALDLDRGWIDFPRPKTGIKRRSSLWPETIAAVRQAIAERPQPQLDEAKDLVFLTVRGRPWLTRGLTQSDPITQSVIKLMKQVGVHRAGLGPYTLRHVFCTVADEVNDKGALDRIMGHGDRSMRERYRERIENEDARLPRLTEHVRQWLYGDRTTTPCHTEPVTTLRMFAG